MRWFVIVGLLISCLLAFATAGYLVGLDRVKGIDERLSAIDTRLDAFAVEFRARQKVGALILDMDEKAGVQCKHEGPHFIAENNQGTYCIDCGAKIKEGRK